MKMAMVVMVVEYNEVGSGGEGMRKHGVERKNVEWERMWRERMWVE